LSPSAYSQLATIPLSTLVGSAQTASASEANPPSRLPSSVPPLTSGGKPEVLYIGAEYCPFCAAERWPMVIALSKFGTFSNLSTTKSSSTDTNPNTPTLSFYGSTYTSPYLVFTPVELQDRNGKTLQTPTPEQNQIISTYDMPPYTTGQPGAIPFIFMGGKFQVSGVQYDGSALSGMSFDNALAYLTSGTNSTSRAAMAVAGHLVGTICSLTNDQPASVCSAVPASLKSGQAISGNQGSSSGG
jgi:thiol-disulfide isomerase/thioredoxin